MKNSLKSLFFFLGIIVVAFIMTWSVLHFTVLIPYDLRNPYSFAGVLSGVFSGLAFLGVIMTLWFQIADSNMQKRLNHVERFESTFFNMLNLHQQIVNGLKFSYEEIRGSWLHPAGDGSIYEEKDVFFNVTGREVFEHLYLKHKFDNYTGFGEYLQNMGMQNYTENLYIIPFDHYFRHLYRIVKFVHDDKILSDEEKYNYIGMLRGTLSRYELVWIFLNGLSRGGNPKFKKLIERYTLLKNLNKESIGPTREFEEFRATHKIPGGEFPNYCWEYYSSYKEDDDKKYYLGAFYRGEDLQQKIDARRQHE